jgi:cbb3-type cytochrome oxidase subunit 3
MPELAAPKSNRSWLSWALLALWLCWIAYLAWASHPYWGVSRSAPEPAQNAERSEL